MFGGQELVLLIIISLVLYFVKGNDKSISKEDEINLGEEILLLLKRKSNIELLSDKKIQQILYQLISDTDITYDNISIYIQNDEDLINAMALPGGIIIFTKGFYRVIETNEITEDEIAGVLAHEIGHIELRHAIRAIKRQQKYGSILKSIEIANVGDLKAGILTELGKNLYKSKFSKAKEFEADEFAVKMLYKSSFSSQGLSTFLEKLDDEYNHVQNGLTIYFASHPPVNKRIDKINKIISNLKNQ